MMIRIIYFATVLLAATSAIPFTQQSGKYIIKLKPQVNQDSVLSFVNAANDGMTVQVAKVRHRYTPGFFNGFAGEFNEQFLRDFEHQYAGQIEYIQKDGRVSISGKQQNPPSWGLARTCSRHPNEKQYYEYPDEAGSGVTVYVVDTGVDFRHSDFGGRAKMGKSFIDGEPATDGHGHGTHCSGTIGSTTYGIAKRVNIVGVKVLGADGSGSDSSVVAGMDYVASNARPGKTVMSMSLGGGSSQAINDAVAAAYNKGVVVIVAAGNESQDACEGSPSGAPKAFAVGAIDSSDKQASFSNYGKCVKIWAPGVQITSTWKGGSTNTISGTSMACPHVAGVAALYMSTKSYTSPQQVYDDLIAIRKPDL